MKSLTWFSTNHLTKMYLGFEKTNKKQDTVSTVHKLAWPIFPHSWSGLEKGITYWCDHHGADNNHLHTCVLGHFGMVTTNQPNNRVILVQACSCPVRRQSFAIHFFVCIIIGSDCLFDIGWVAHRSFSLPLTPFAGNVGRGRYLEVVWFKMS